MSESNFPKWYPKGAPRKLNEGQHQSPEDVMKQYAQVNSVKGQSLKIVL